MIAAALLAKKAVEARSTCRLPGVKTSLAPGSRVVSDYLEKTGLPTSTSSDLVGYGCTTCIGNSGPLHPNIEKTIHEYDLVAASVLSGNRNFEARVHRTIKVSDVAPSGCRLCTRRPSSHRSFPRSTWQGQGRQRNFPSPIYKPEALSEIQHAMQRALTPEKARNFIVISQGKIRSGTKFHQAQAISRFTSGTRSN